MKRLLLVFLCLVLCYVLIGCDQPLAPTEGIIYDLSEDGTYAEVVGYSGTATEIVIADTYNGVPVINICEKAFQGNKAITSVNIPDSVTSIDSYAFSNCSNLENISVASDNATYKSIDGNLYAKDGKTLIQYAIGKNDTCFVIPDSVTSIGEGAFYYCSSLTSITIPDSVASIGNYAFEYCSSLISITIPNSVTFIGEDAFYYCSSLTSVTIPDSVTSIGNHAFEYCSSLTSINIPDSVTSIGERAFYYCSRLTSVTIPDSVTSIGDWAFCYCPSLTSVNIPDSVTSIGEGAFWYCTNLISVTIPDSVTSIGEGAFCYCSRLTSITIPDLVTSIDEGAFGYCSSLTSIKYRGTEEQWNAISKGTDWDLGSDSYTIIYNYTEE